MTDLARLFDFTANDTIRSGDVDAEFNQLVAGHNAQEDALEVLSTYRTIERVSGWLGDAGYHGAGDHLFGSLDDSLVPESTDGPGAFAAFYLDDADYLVTGKTPKLRVRAQAYVNGVAPARTVTVGLYPLSSVGTGGPSSDNIQATLGAVLAGSTVPFASPGSSSRSQGNSGDFGFPTDDHYALGVNLAGGALAPNSRIVICAQLQLRHV